MPALAAMACSVSLLHFYSVAAVEDEHSDSVLVACLAAVAAAEVV